MLPHSSHLLQHFLYQLIYCRLYNLLFHRGDHPFPVSTAILNIHLGFCLCGECSVRIACTSFMYLLLWASDHHPLSPASEIYPSEREMGTRWEYKAVGRIMYLKYPIWRARHSEVMHQSIQALGALRESRCLNCSQQFSQVQKWVFEHRNKDSEVLGSHRLTAAYFAFNAVSGG